MSEPLMYTRSETSLAAAWARAFLQMSTPPERELSPFLVSIAAGADGLPVEDDDLRDVLDACLEETGDLAIEKVAKSIFPQAMWKRSGGDRQKLYANYRESLPDFVAMEPQKNRFGLYFGRLIGYGMDHKTGDPLPYLKEKLNEDGNQLEYIIKACKPKVQRMALQASVFDPARDGGTLQAAIFDPARDQTEARRHFPCLQHVSFAPDFARKTLSLNAFYALQLLYVKGYGNWLGLCRLGAFVASQTGIRFERLNCYAGIQKMTAGSRPQPGVLLDRLTDVAKGCIEQQNVHVAGAKR